jgi:hypothetical protein
MAIDALEFPELHDESIPYMAFIKNCAKLLAAAGVRDFSMQARNVLLLASRVVVECCMHAHNNAA